MTEPTTEELLATVRRYADALDKDRGYESGPARVMRQCAARLEAAERPLPRMELILRRAEAAEREVERLREALRNVAALAEGHGSSWELLADAGEVAGRALAILDEKLAAGSGFASRSEVASSPAVTQHLTALIAACKMAEESGRWLRLALAAEAESE
jgi:hypothetical protein